jgi:hypothetical protein
MKSWPILLACLPFFSLVLAPGCSSDAPADETDTLLVGDEDMTKLDDGKSDSSVEAVIVNFEFDGELITTSTWNPKSKIQDQFLYTIGHLNGDRSVARLDLVELTNIQTTEQDGKVKISYHAKLPVAWGKRDNIPTSYKLQLPRDVSYEGLEAFTTKYSHDCVDSGAHDVDSGSMWYYYRPSAYRCKLAEADVVAMTATVGLSDMNTTGKYPEYHKIWEDDALRVVAVFGKYEDGATTSSDAGIAAYNRFVGGIKSELSPFGVVTTPADVPSSPGIATPDIAFEATLADGKKVYVTALLVDNVRTAGATFDARYEALSTQADLIVYNGHAGLGANVRALATKGEWTKGQYVMAFLNGCDSYTYIDSALFDAHRAVNPDDTVGTKYVDIVTNVMPSFFSSMSNATMAIVRGLLSWEQPKTYEQIFKSVDSSQVVIVSGEQDNEYFPGWPGGGDEPVVGWEGMEQSGTVAAGIEDRYETPPLGPGSYEFAMTGDNDADLFVRIGEPPTKQLWDCRPFKTGSNETCAVELTATTPVHVMVRGWASSSNYSLAGHSR